MQARMWRLYASEALSGGADGVVWVIVVVAFADDRHLGYLLALGVAARLGPRVVFSMAAGALVDRSDLRRLLVLTSVARALMMAALVVVLDRGAAWWLVLLILLCSNIAGVPLRPGLAAAVPLVAGERQLALANARLSTIKQIASFVGPLLGVGFVGVSAEFGAGAAGVAYLFAALSVAGVSGLPRRSSSFLDSLRIEPARRRSVVQESGWRIRAVEGMPMLVCLIAAMYFVRGAEMVLQALVVRDLLGASPSTIGWLTGAVGVGAVIAIPLASRAADTGLRTAVGIAVVCTAVPTSALVMVSEIWAAGALLVVVGVGMVLFEVATVVAVQRVVAIDHLGRAFGAVNTAANAGRLAGAVAAPPLVAALDVSGSLLVVAGILVAVTVVSHGALTVIGTRAEWRRRSLEPRVQVLAGLDVFEGAGRTALESLATRLTEESLAAGEVVVREGDEPDDLYIVRDGEFAVTIVGRLVNTMGPDDWFGEIGLVGRVPRTATVVATTDADVWRIPGQDFLDALEDSGAEPTALVEGIADRLASGAYRAEHLHPTREGWPPD